MEPHPTEQMEQRQWRRKRRKWSKCLSHNCFFVNTLLFHSHSVCLPLSVCLSLSVSRSSLCLSFPPSQSLSVSPSQSLSLCLQGLCLNASLSLFLSLSLHFVSLCISVCLTVSLCLSVPLSVSHTLCAQLLINPFHSTFSIKSSFFASFSPLSSFTCFCQRLQYPTLHTCLQLLRSVSLISRMSVVELHLVRRRIRCLVTRWLRSIERPAIGSSCLSERLWSSAFHMHQVLEEQERSSDQDQTSSSKDNSKRQFSQTQLYLCAPWLQITAVDRIYIFVYNLASVLFLFFLLLMFC